MLPRFCLNLFFFAGLFAVVLPGCNKPNSSVDASVLAKQRSRLLLAEEPDGGQSVLDVREMLLALQAEEDAKDHSGHNHGPGGHAIKAQEVVIVGRIGGLANPWKEMQPDFPFGNDRAIVFLADLGAVAEKEVGGHNHAPGEECAFCESNAEDNSSMLAMVRFLDEKGEVLPMDVRQLFDVKGQETVVVRGLARIVTGEMLVIDATGLCVRR